MRFVMVKRVKKIQYINNNDFLQALKDYKQSVVDAEQSHKPRPKMPNYIGECFMKLATNLAKKGNFSSYTWKDEMIEDAIENQILYFHNFDPEKSSNPFAYFTQICNYAFIRRIAKEKKQQYIKYKTAENFSLMEEDEAIEGEFDTQFMLYENNYEFIEQYEQNMKKKKEIVHKPKGIELFLEN